MTSRYDWHLGASSSILGGWESHTKEAFSQYESSSIRYAEFAISREAGLVALDFLQHPEKIAALAAENGMELVSFHIPFSNELSLSNSNAVAWRNAAEITKACILAAKNIGIKTMVLHPSRGCYDQYSSREALVNQCMEHVGELYAFCESHGLTLALENMTGQGVCNVPEEMIAFLREFPGLGVCFDTNHPTRIAPEAYLDTLLRAGMQGRIKAVHISDYDLQEERHWLPGMGKINWPAVIQKLEELEFNRVFMYEVSRKYTSLAQLSENFELLITGKL